MAESLLPLLLQQEQPKFNCCDNRKIWNPTFVQLSLRFDTSRIFFKSANGKQAWPKVRKSGGENMITKCDKKTIMIINGGSKLYYDNKKMITNDIIVQY